VRRRLEHAIEPAFGDGDRYQPMWAELEALVGSTMRAANLLAERRPLLPSDGLFRSIAQVRVPQTLASLIPEPRLGTPRI
jgi:hypothetical protein